MTSARRLEHRVAILTGATGGIGSAIARRLGEEGARLVLGFLEKADAAHDLEQELRQAGVTAMIAQVDVQSSESVRRMVESTIARLGRIDMLVNSAAVLRSDTIDEFKEADWELTFNVNVKGSVLCAREVARIMRDQGGGSIVNIASRFALLGAPKSLAYGASKAALINITKALANYYAPTIRVNAVAPAYTLTRLTAHEPPVFLESFVNQVPLHRAATPEDTAAAVAYLVSDDASFVTGHTLYVDGGYIIR